MENLGYYFIYTLSDPRGGDVRYVGATRQPQTRLMSHCRPRKHTYKDQWIRELIRDGVRPRLEIIDIGIGDWSESEQAWILGFRQRGCRLLNGTDGGEGVNGYVRTSEWKRQLSERMKAMCKRDCYRSAMLARLAMTRTPQALKKRSEAIKARWREGGYVGRVDLLRSGEYKAKMSAREKTKWSDPEFRERLVSIMRSRRKDPPSKQCRCGATFTKNPHRSYKQWDNTKYCKKCSPRMRIGIV